MNGSDQENSLKGSPRRGAQALRAEAPKRAPRVAAPIVRYKSPKIRLYVGR